MLLQILVKGFYSLWENIFPRTIVWTRYSTQTLWKSSTCVHQRMKKMTQQHNASLLNTEVEQTTHNCNCQSRQNCLLNGECLKFCLIYKAEVTADGKTSLNFGASEGEFNTQYNNHTKSFQHKKYENKTEFSWLI